MNMPGRSEDKLFWCIVASLVLMFIKDGFIIIAIIWACFFLIILPREIRARNRARDYEDLERHPNKYRAAILYIRDVCNSSGISRIEAEQNAWVWWIKELDAETRNYLRKTSYYNHPRFKGIKELDSGIAKKDKEYVAAVNQIGKENIKAITYAKRLVNYEIGPDKRMLESWWRNIGEEARDVVRRSEYYDHIQLTTIRYYDKEMKRLKLLPEYKNDT